MRDPGRPGPRGAGLGSLRDELESGGQCRRLRRARRSRLPGLRPGAARERQAPEPGRRHPGRAGQAAVGRPADPQLSDLLVLGAGDPQGVVRPGTGVRGLLWRQALLRPGWPGRQEGAGQPDPGRAPAHVRRGCRPRTAGGHAAADPARHPGLCRHAGAGALCRLARAIHQRGSARQLPARLPGAAGKSRAGCTPAVPAAGAVRRAAPAAGARTPATRPPPGKPRSPPPRGGWGGGVHGGRLAL